MVQFRKPWTLFCQVCGDQFQAIRRTAVYCSAKCRQQQCRAMKCGKPIPTHPNFGWAKRCRDGREWRITV